MQLTPTRAYLTSLATDARQAAAGVAGPLHAAYLGLFIAPSPIPTVNTVLADLTEAGYTGYLRQALVYGGTYIDQDGDTAFDAGSLEFQPSDAVAPQTITGVMVVSLVAAGVLLLAGRLDSPVALPDALHLIDLLAQFKLGPTLIGGTVAVVC